MKKHKIYASKDKKDFGEKDMKKVLQEGMANVMSYIDALDELIILPDVSNEDYKDAIRKLKEANKIVQKWEDEEAIFKIFDRDKVEEYIENGLSYTDSSISTKPGMDFVGNEDSEYLD